MTWQMIWVPLLWWRQLASTMSRRRARVTLVLLALVNWQVAVLYIVVWTVGLLFGVRQQRTTTLRVDHAGLQYEAGTFVLRAAA